MSSGIRYSDLDKKQFIIAFMELFNVEASVCKHPDIVEWMENAAVGCIEYDERLKGETAHGKDERMEMMEVYDGNVHNLVPYLRSLYPEYNSLTKWGLIFTIYNEIMDVQELIEEASQSVVEVEDKEAVKNDSFMNSPVVEDIAEENNSSLKSNVAAVHKEMPSGNPLDNTEQSLFNKNNKNKIHKEGITMPEENKNLSNLEELAQQAKKEQDLGGSSDESKETAKPQVSSGMINAAKEIIKNTIAERVAWGKNNFVSKAIIATEPTSLRFSPGTTGIINTNEGTAKQTSIDKVYATFKKVTGYEPLNVKEGEELTLVAKFPNVKTDDDLLKAKAVLDLILKIKEKPDMEIPIWIPESPTYSVKGAVVEGVNYSNAELRDLLIEKSAGAIYAVGSLDAKGNPIKEATVFGLSVVGRKKSVNKATEGKSLSTAGTAQKVQTIDGMVKIKNKNNFLKNGNNILVVYPTIANATPEQKKYVGVKASVDVEGKTVPASFKYESDEKKKDATGKDIEAKTKTFSLTVRALVSLTSATPNAMFGTPEEAANRFGSAAGMGNSGNEAIDYTDIDSVTKALEGRNTKKGVVESSIVKLIAAMANGQTESKAKGGAADVINKVKFAGTEAEDKANEEAANEMEEDLA